MLAVVLAIALFPGFPLCHDERRRGNLGKRLSSCTESSCNSANISSCMQLVALLAVCLKAVEGGHAPVTAHARRVVTCKETAVLTTIQLAVSAFLVGEGIVPHEYQRNYILTTYEDSD